MRQVFRVFLYVSLVQGLVAVVCPAPSFAQERPRFVLRPDFGVPERPPLPATQSAQTKTFYNWEIDFHTGAAWANAPGGTTTLPAAGSTFPMFNGLPTRSVRSWYFGDG